LMKILAGALQPDRGEVYIRGTHAHLTAPRRLRPWASASSTRNSTCSRTSPWWTISFSGGAPGACRHGFRPQVNKANELLGRWGCNWTSARRWGP
jgi:hypothetical protein